MRWRSCVTLDWSWAMCVGPFLWFLVVLEAMMTPPLVTASEMNLQYIDCATAEGNGAGEESVVSLLVRHLYNCVRHWDLVMRLARR
ncbi:hypothetical protein EDB92DRAFT_1834992, partial [Lactarius akahatsu]